MAKASRDKGKRGEREFAAFLTERGIPARRGVQFRGGGDSPDVVHAIPGVHFEVKRVEALKLLPSLHQASEDAGDKIPVVAWRKNGGAWIAILRADDLVDILVAEYQPNIEDLL